MPSELTKSGAQFVERLGLAKIERAAVRHWEGIFDGTNPEAELPWRDVSVKTKGALEITKVLMVTQRAKALAKNPPVQLGVVVVTPQLANEDEWNRWQAKKALAERKTIDLLPEKTS